ncbi:HAD family hydrolase [Gayadomonas joobiniege]|uniref:HAD family hydrolase n=1 Tax=Gayadomonas joobiniege TaxID=1234606 RepID=UPI00037A9E73|nr:HAD family phosphatase [Gayadomonas joobiniege]
MTLDKPHYQPTKIELVIFDCDGVLIDSELLSKGVLLSMLESIGVKVSRDYFDRYFLGHNYASVKAQIFTDFSVNLSDQFRQDYLNNLFKVFAKKLTTTPNLPELLARLKVPSCVATGCSQQRVNFSLATTGLKDYFEQRIFTCSEVKKSKPEPDIFLHAAKKMSVSPAHCLVIEDSKAGIQAGQAANMRVLRYAGASHLKNKKDELSDKVDTIYQWESLYDSFPSLFKLGKR